MSVDRNVFGRTLWSCGNLEKMGSVEPVNVPESGCARPGNECDKITASLESSSYDINSPITPQL